MTILDEAVAMANTTKAALQSALDRIPRANSAHVFLEIQGFPANTFKVLTLDGSEGLSRELRFAVSVAADANLDLHALAGAKAKLLIDWDGDKRPIQTIVTEATDVGALVEDGAHEFALTLGSPLTPLNLTHRSRVFLNQDAPTILKKVLTDAGIENERIRLDLKQSYPVLEFTAQYDESDYNFFARTTEQWGMVYGLVHDDDGATVLVTDDSESLPKLDGLDALPVRAPTGGVETEEVILTIQPRARYCTGGVRLKDWNYRTPEATLAGESAAGDTPAYGHRYLYGENGKSLDEINLLTRARQEALNAERDQCVAETTCRGIASGHFLTVTNHADASRNGDYLVLAVTHRADQTDAYAFGGGRNPVKEKRSYVNEVLFLRKGTPYRAPVDDAKLPVVPGILTARIESEGGDYAYLDDQGRYRTKLHLDPEDTSPAQASHPMRMMQPYGGDQYGLHFPLHAGTEVLVSCVNGDPDRPVILGAAANPETQSPVTANNYTHNVVRTVSGHELRMDDLKGSEQILLFTKDQKNRLALDAAQDQHSIGLETQEGKMQLSCAKTLTVESGDSITVQTGNNQDITVENRHTLQTKNQDIQFTAGTDILHTAQNSIKLHAETQNLELTAEQDLIVEAGENMSVRVADQDMEVVVESGSMSIEAAKAISVLGQGGGAITIAQGGGTVEISTSGDITLKAPSITIEGASVNIKGMQVGNN